MIVSSLAIAWAPMSQVEVYECETLPPENGWTLLNSFCDPIEFVDSSKLIYTVDICDSPPEGQQIDYTRSLDSFLGETEFFLEFKVESTGSADELPFSAPTVLTASNSGGVLYHFSIARDEFRFILDIGEYFPIAANIPHTFRVEAMGERAYRVFVDGNIIDQGPNEGLLTEFSPKMNLRAKSKFGPSDSIWHFIRWGVIPEDASADFDSNGIVDEFDLFYIDECIERSASGEPTSPSCTWADVDANNIVDCIDRETILEDLWSGPRDPQSLPVCEAGIPTTSEWGLVILAGGLVTGATLLFRRRQQHA